MIVKGRCDRCGAEYEYDGWPDHDDKPCIARSLHGGNRLCGGKIKITTRDPLDRYMNRSRWWDVAEIAALALLLWATVSITSWLVRPHEVRTLLPLEDLEHAAYPYNQPVQPERTSHGWFIHD